MTETFTEDQECTVGKDSISSRQLCDTCEESETSLSNVAPKPDDRKCTTVDSSPKIATEAEEKDSTEEICRMQRSETRNIQGAVASTSIDDANGVEGVEVPEGDSSTAGKVDESDSTRPDT